MAHYEVDCVDCGGPSTASRKDAKYCASCKTIRILSFLRGKYKRARKCRVCDEKFVPAQQLDLSYCGPCETRQRGDTVTEQHCRFCQKFVQENVPLPTVCRCCMKDPTTQKRILDLLRRGQKERQAQHAVVLADQKTGTPHIRRVR